VRVPEILCCRLIGGHPPPSPQASVSELYCTLRELEKQKGGEPFRTGKGVGGPNSYDRTETLVLNILYSI
jgi:hypothetical protein